MEQIKNGDFDKQEIISMLMDCRNIIDRCESVTIGKTQLNIKVIEIDDLICKLMYESKMETKELNIIPISMRCTQEQYKSIKPILDANGISNDFVFSYADTFLVTNYSNGIDVMNVSSLDAEKFGRTIFTEWDEKIFLKCLGLERKDNINPSHYKRLPKETIERIKDNLTPEEFKGYLKGNILKYLDRYQDKNGVEDLRKMNWYLNKLIEVEATEIKE